MSTTVSYKNNTLATVNNQTKTLKTAGKYLEDDITLVDVSGGVEAISIVDTPDAAGGTVRTITALDISDTTAVATDVAQGKYFYTAAGVKTAGTASGSGGNVKTKTGTFTGDNTTSVSISCDFAPDLIYVYGDMSASVSDRGVVSITIVKDTMILHTADTSTSSTTDSATFFTSYGVSGYTYDSSHCRAEYSNGTLTITTGESSSSNRFTSGITYSYKLMTWTAGGATQHTIHLEFSDNTDADIDVDYDDSWVGSMITSTEPTMYGQKTIVEAQLDGTTWYEYTPISIGVELVDYTTVLADTGIGSDGSTITQEWYYTSDYIAIDPSMSFNYRASTWFYIGFYASDYTAISTLYVYTDGTQDPNDSNTSYGTLTGKIPSNAAYVRLCGTWPDSAHLSLIRTA